MRYYGLYAIFADATNAAGKSKSYFCDITDLGWTLNEIYREDPLEVVVAGVGDDETTVRTALLMAVAEDTAVRAQADILRLERDEGTVRSIFVEYANSPSPLNEFAIVAETLRELVAHAMAAVTRGATNLLTTYRGNSVEVASVRVAEYVLRAFGLIEQDGVSV
jgi:hypothetical protein